MMPGKLKDGLARTRRTNSDGVDQWNTKTRTTIAERKELKEETNRRAAGPYICSVQTESCISWQLPCPTVLVSADQRVPLPAFYVMMTDGDRN